MQRQQQASLVLNLGLEIAEKEDLAPQPVCEVANEPVAEQNSTTDLNSVPLIDHWPF